MAEIIYKDGKSYSTPNWGRAIRFTIEARFQNELRIRVNFLWYLQQMPQKPQFKVIWIEGREGYSLTEEEKNFFEGEIEAFLEEAH